MKSLRERNEEKQLRLGIGQVLRYRHLLATVYPVVKPVLALERHPSDASWLNLCADLGIRVVWPGTMGQVLVELIGS